VVLWSQVHGRPSRGGNPHPSKGRASWIKRLAVEDVTKVEGCFRQREIHVKAMKAWGNFQISLGHSGSECQLNMTRFQVPGREIRDKK
jgi:hypothetical protein